MDNNISNTTFICIRDYELSNLSSSTTSFISGNSYSFKYWIINYWIYIDNKGVKSLIHNKIINTYFVPIEEYRDNQINTIIE